MSAPKTNIEKEKKRHKVPLVGMAWMIGFAAVLLVALVLWLSFQGNEPGDDTSIDAETGADGTAPESSATE